MIYFLIGFFLGFLITVVFCKDEKLSKKIFAMIFWEIIISFLLLFLTTGILNTLSG